MSPGTAGPPSAMEAGGPSDPLGPAMTTAAPGASPAGCPGIIAPSPAAMGSLPRGATPLLAGSRSSEQEGSVSVPATVSTATTTEVFFMDDFSCPSMSTGPALHGRARVAAPRGRGRSRAAPSAGGSRRLARKKESRTVASQSSAPLAYAVRGNTSEVLCGAMLGEPGPSTRGPAAPADDANTHLLLPTPCTSAGHSTERRQQARANGRAD